jgi:hypothetical protein
MVPGQFLLNCICLQKKAINHSKTQDQFQILGANQTCPGVSLILQNKRFRHFSAIGRMRHAA